MHFKLSDIETHVHIGITPEERSEVQLLLISVDFEFEAQTAAKSDDIADTVNYQAIYDTIKHVTENGEWNLLEALHAELLDTLIKTVPAAENLMLSIEKFPWEDGSIRVT